MPMPLDPPDRGAVARRDAGLRRVSRLTRWLLAGSLALTAAFSAIAARGFPGSSGDQATSSTAADQSSQTSASDSDQIGEDTATTLQSPSSTPSASAGSGAVTSGGS